MTMLKRERQQLQRIAKELDFACKYLDDDRTIVSRDYGLYSPNIEPVNKHIGNDLACLWRAQRMLNDMLEQKGDLS